MEFSSSPETSKAVSIGFAAVALVFFYFTLFTATGLDSLILLFIALFFSFASYSALKSKYRVTFDANRKQVCKRFEAGIFKHKKTFPLRHFDSVGIGIGGRGGTPASTIVYFIQLLGENNLKVSITSADCEKVTTDAEALAEFLALPLDKKPRTVIFNKRI